MGSLSPTIENVVNKIITPSAPHSYILVLATLRREEEVGNERADIELRHFRSYYYFSVIISYSLQLS